MDKKNVVFLISIIVGLIIFILLRIFVFGKFYFTNIDVTKYEKLLQSEEKTLIYITSNECIPSKTTTPLIEKVLAGSKIKVNLLNLSNLETEEITKFASLSEITKNGYSTPMLLFIENKQIKNNLTGLFTEDEFINFLVDNKIVE